MGGCCSFGTHSFARTGWQCTEVPLNTVSVARWWRSLGDSVMQRDDTTQNAVPGGLVLRPTVPPSGVIALRVALEGNELCYACDATCGGAGNVTVGPVSHQWLRVTHSEQEPRTAEPEPGHSATPPRVNCRLPLHEALRWHLRGWRHRVGGDATAATSDRSAELPCCDGRSGQALTCRCLSPALAGMALPQRLAATGRSPAQTRAGQRPPGSWQRQP